MTVDQGNCVTVKGPKGQLEQQFPTDITVELADSEVQVTRPTDDQAPPGVARPEPGAAEQHGDRA